MNRRHRIVGYELAFGGSSETRGTARIPDVGMRARIIAEGFANFGPRVLLADTLGFLPVDEPLLMGDFVESLPEGRIVLQIPPLLVVGEALRKRLRELRRLGFQIALDDFVRRDPRRELLDLVSYVRVDATAVDKTAMRRLVQRAHKHRAQLVATRVESPDQLGALVSAAVDLFQGYYFAQPVALSGAEINPDHAALLELLSRLQQNAELPEIEEQIKKRAGLGVGLLRLVNAAGVARAQKIGSVGQALVLIGRRELERWLNLLLYTEAEPSTGAAPLFSLAATRGKTMEILAAELSDEARNGSGPDVVERAFLTGMLSLVHVLLGIPAERVVDEIHVEDDVREALLERDGPLGKLLCVKERIEVGAFGEAGEILAALGLEAPQLQRAQAEAYAWVADLGRGA